jgi:mono/diheme cytochrome c family protein
LLTEIPEHLLRRSRERRAALGLPSAGGEEGESDSGAAPAPLAPAESRPARAASAEVAPQEAPSPALIEQPAAQVPAYVAPRGPHKTKVPLWVMPVLIALPLWAFLYPGAFGNHQKTATADPLTVGTQVYHSAGCSGCHGANGEGGVGPALHGGESVKTFPNIADQINWVKNGSQGLKQGTLYGDPNRAGGQRFVKEPTGDMPGFSSSLSAQQIQDVVLYERQRL